MKNDLYLVIMAKSGSWEEFCLRYTIETGRRFEDDRSFYENDYLNRMKDSPIYMKKLYYGKRFSLSDHFGCGLPVLKNVAREIDSKSFAKILKYTVYDKNGREMSTNVNLDLAEDMHAIWEIDTEAEMENILKFELKKLI